MTDDILQPAEVADFDEFWSAKQRKGLHFRIRGVDCELPPRMPVQFELEARRMENSTDGDDVKRLVGLLVGRKSLDRLLDAGLDEDEFSVLLLWATCNLKGKPMSISEAYTAYTEVKDQPDPPRPSAKRKKGTSGGR